VVGVDDAWPPDFDMNRAVDMLDLLDFKLHFSAISPDPLYDSRFDLAGQDGIINIADALQYKAHWLDSCSP
jgi:hypothetical protein